MPTKYKPGQKFNRLTLIERLRKNDVRNKFPKKNCWLVKCDCNNEIILPMGALVTGNTGSCGCLKSELCHSKSHSWQGYKEIPKTFWNRIQSNAKSREIEFDIDIEYVWKLFLKQKRKCALSGCVLKFSSQNNTIASLDRIDSKKGYIKGNIQWVHKTIQKMKFVYSQNYFLNICEAVADYSE